MSEGDVDARLVAVMEGDAVLDKMADRDALPDGEAKTVSLPLPHTDALLKLEPVGHADWAAVPLAAPLAETVSTAVKDKHGETVAVNAPLRVEACEALAAMLEL